MLTQDSYFTAMALYTGAGLIALILAYRYLLTPLPTVIRRAIIGLLAGLLLTPAYSASESATLAPALVVGVFNLFFAEGWESARQAFMLLGVASAAGLLMGIGSTLVGRGGFGIEKAHRETEDVPTAH